MLYVIQLPNDYWHWTYNIEHYIRLFKTEIKCSYIFQYKIKIKVVENNIWERRDMEFIFECSHRYRTSEHSERMRYRISISSRLGIYPPLFTSPSGDSCFSIYQIRWIKKRLFNLFFWNFRETTRHFLSVRKTVNIQG